MNKNQSKNKLITLKFEKKSSLTMAMNDAITHGESIANRFAAKDHSWS